MSINNCYIKDPKTGLFMGSKPGCSSGSKSVPDELMARVDQDKDRIQRWVDHVSEHGKGWPVDSPQRAKAERLAEKVLSGQMSYEQGLSSLATNPREVFKYTTAAEILHDDIPFWNGVGKVAGSEYVDEFMFKYVKGTVDGVYDFVSGVTSQQDDNEGKPNNSLEALAANTGNLQKLADAPGTPEKKDEISEVYHTELATPDNYKGDLNKLHEENFTKSREELAKGGVSYPDKDVAKHIGDGYWTGQASEYKPTGKLTAKRDKYEKVPTGVAINRIFGYQTEPKIRDNFVVIGDVGKEDGKIEIRPVRDTGMYSSYIDKNGVKQKYPTPTNIVDLHKGSVDAKGSLDNFCGKPGCGRQPIMMKTCQTIPECRKIQKEMKEKIKKWRDENVKKR
ncbi:MAG: hypothetical protein H7843_04575 [Nitrospirota bacterium]